MMRQWVPQTQRNVAHLTREVHGGKELEGGWGGGGEGGRGGGGAGVKVVEKGRSVHTHVHVHLYIYNVYVTVSGKTDHFVIVSDFKI